MQPYMDGKAEVVEFNGIKFRRYPESKRWSDKWYFRPHSGHIRAGVEAYHRELWKSVHGKIPDGCHVHHIDGNPLNNDISNLDCVRGSSHSAIHEPMRTDEYRQRRIEYMRKANEASKPWHSTPDGIAFHKDNGLKSWEDRELTTKHCEHCGKEYETPFPTRSRFCTPNCASKSRYARNLYSEERTCKNCGKTFSVSKWEKTQNCSRSCAAKLRNREKGGRFQS